MQAVLHVLKPTFAVVVVVARYSGNQPLLKRDERPRDAVIAAGTQQSTLTNVLVQFGCHTDGDGVKHCPDNLSHGHFQLYAHSTTAHSYVLSHSKRVAHTSGIACEFCCLPKVPLYASDRGCRGGRMCPAATTDGLPVVCPNRAYHTRLHESHLCT